MNWLDIQKKMEELGYWLQLMSPFSKGDCWWAGFTPLNTTGWNGRPDFKGCGATPDEAVLNAALKVQESLENSIEFLRGL